MKSIKPGRGKSGMSFVATIGVIIFGIIWTVVAASITSGIPGISFVFPMFGIVFIFIGIAQAVYHYKNATGKKRFSTFDIVDSKEEGDPGDQWITNDAVVKDTNENEEELKSGFNYCPYCRFELDDDYKYCPSCGKEL